MRQFFILCLSVLAFMPPVVEAEEAANFSIQPAPDWVRPVAPPEPSATAPEGEGIDYLLVDNQENVEPRAAYYHEVRSIYSESGVQNGSALTVSFDPSYQKLAFHTLKVTRKSRTTDRWDRSRIKLFQRESEMDYFLYDGNYTAQCQLEDIRVGDTIEFSYTIAGVNPVMQGHYTDTFDTNWSTSVRRVFTRLIYPATRQLHFAFRNKEMQPVITTSGGKTEWVLDELAVPPQHDDGSLPVGYSPYGAVQVTDFGSWSEVVAWALPLYTVQLPLTPELEEEIAVLRAIADPDQRVLAALRFVQDEIRYLGIEMGVGSHQPTHPGEVLLRRFGDCKDKTQLLGLLLRETGIEVAPALVNTGLGKEVAKRLPSATVFNHVILQVTTSSGVHWLDSTRSRQRGSLSQICVGDYGFALVVRAGETALTSYSPPPDSLPKTKVVETFRIGAPGEESFFDVTTEYRGLNAERNRNYHQEHVAAELDKQYLKFYAKQFPGVEMARPHTYTEMPNGEGCVITEHYRVPEIWVLNDEKTKYSVFLYPSDLENAMGDTVSPQRTDPLGINYPVNVAEEIHVEMFQDWPLDTKPDQVANRFFHFRHEPKSGGRKMQMSYSFETRADRVPATDVVAYNTALRKVKDSLGYTLSYFTPEQIAAKKLANPGADTTKNNWLPLIINGFLFVGISVVLLVLVFTTKQQGPPPLPSDQPWKYDQSHELQGLRGWLLLMALGVVARPIVFFNAVRQIGETIVDLERWQMLTTPGGAGYHPLWQAGLLFEFTFYWQGISFCLFVAILFFKKRALFPKCMIGLLIYSVIGTGFDYILSLQIPAAHSSQPESLKGLIQNVCAAAIWIPYLLISRRVRNTFRL